jgi:AmpD protein
VAVRSRWLPQGLLEAARQAPSPNRDARPPDSRVDLLVIHNISLPPGRFCGGSIEELFLNSLDFDRHPAFAALRGLRVSAHFLIRRRGELLQFVPCDLRAWHAGVSSWAGREHCNDFSIGVELEGTDERSYTAAQYRRLVWLTRALRERYPIADIVGHSDIAPGRKTDPGQAFDWPSYRALLAHGI